MSEKGLTAKRTMFIVLFAVNLVVTLAGLWLLPARVACHFGVDGVANGWMSGAMNACLMMATHSLLFFVIYFSPGLMVVMPPRWVNLPHKEYWLSPANRLEAKQKLQTLMWRFGATLFLYFLIMNLLTLEANLTTPVRLDTRLFWLTFGGFLIYTGAWIIQVYRAFRVPATRGVDHPA